MASRWRVRLIDLMALILVAGLLTALMMPALNSSRPISRRLQCGNGLKQVGLGLQGYLNSKHHYPNAGTFREFPGSYTPSSSTIAGCFTTVTGVPFRPPRQPANVAPDYGPLHSWVVDILPYIDANDLAGAWDHDKGYASTVAAPGNPSNLTISSKSIGVLVCPNDATAGPGGGNLSYVVNGGFSRWVGDPTIGWTGTANGGSDTRIGPDWGIDVAAQTGVMFLGTETGRAPWDRRTTERSLVDGASQTILASENIRAGASVGSATVGGSVTNWACPHPNAIMFIASDKICPGGRCAATSAPPALTEASGKDGDAWSLANSPASNPFEAINHGAKKAISEAFFPFPSSGHAGGVNVLFCDGSVRFVKETIDGTVYAKLITPAGTALPPEYQQLPIINCEF